MLTPFQHLFRTTRCPPAERFRLLRRSRGDFVDAQTARSVGRELFALAITLAAVLRFVLAASRCATPPHAGQAGGPSRVKQVVKKSIEDLKILLNFCFTAVLSVRTVGLSDRRAGWLHLPRLRRSRKGSIRHGVEERANAKMNFLYAVVQAIFSRGFVIFLYTIITIFSSAQTMLRSSFELGASALAGTALAFFAACTFVGSFLARKEKKYRVIDLGPVFS